MGFGSWVKSLLGSKGAPGGEEVKGLNFHSAIGAHMLWRRRLSDVINGASNERLVPAQVGAADQCVLGKWLNGPIRDDYADSSEFQALVQEHASFHECASRILQKALAGQKQDAQQMLTGGEFQQLSSSVCVRLGRLYQGITGHALEDEADDDGVEDEIAGLNFRNVLDSHMSWRQRLSDVINGKSDEQLSVAVVGADNQCRLGKWLQGPIKNEFAGDPEFQALVREHARFHECAGQVLQHAQAGRKNEAQKLLAGGEFVELSRLLCSRLLKLHQQLGKR